MNIEPIDLGDELWKSVEAGLHFAPVVFRAPIARERLNRGELYALRSILDRFPFRPSRRVDAPAQFGEFRLRDIDGGKRTNHILVSRLFAGVGSRNFCHGVLLRGCFGLSCWATLIREGLSPHCVCGLKLQWEAAVTGCGKGKRSAGFRPSAGRFMLRTESYPREMR